MRWLSTNMECVILLWMLTLVACAPEDPQKLLSRLDATSDAGNPTAIRQAQGTGQQTGQTTGMATQSPNKVEQNAKAELRVWQEVLETLPRDVMGGLDWVKALQDAVITPRVKVDSVDAPEPPADLVPLVQKLVAEGKTHLDLDVAITPSKNPYFKVVFPHAGHTLWLHCSSCHPDVIAQRGVGMDEIKKGAYCGKCHGKVSFAVETGCPRCHVNLPTPTTPQTAKAFGVKGNIVFPREEQVGSFPPATFPHWFHRIRFRCKACHPSIFKMQRGANPITMGKIERGQFCGVCHNGRTAWPINFANCKRCHVRQRLARRSD